MTAGGYGFLDTSINEERLVLDDYIHNGLSISDLASKYKYQRNKVVRILQRQGIMHPSYHHNPNYCPFYIDPSYYLQNPPYRILIPPPYDFVY